MCSLYESRIWVDTEKNVSKLNLKADFNGAKFTLFNLLIFGSDSYHEYLARMEHVQA